jgi:hypothetical protein
MFLAFKKREVEMDGQDVEVRSFGKREYGSRKKRRLENSHRGSRWTRSRRLGTASQVDTSVVAIVGGGFADGCGYL